MKPDEITERWLLGIEGRCMGRTLHVGTLTPPGHADMEFRFEDAAEYKQIQLTNSATGKKRVYRLSKAPGAPTTWQEAGHGDRQPGAQQKPADNA